MGFRGYTVEQDNVQSSDLVVVGSSAEGIEAFSILVSTLPEDFPAPLVLAQHLDPESPQFEIRRYFTKTYQPGR